MHYWNVSIFLAGRDGNSTIFVIIGQIVPNGFVNAENTFFTEAGETLLKNKVPN